MLNGVIILEDGTFQQIGTITKPNDMRRAILMVLLAVEQEVARLEEEKNSVEESANE